LASYISAEQRVPSDHPLRAVRRLVDDVLREMSREFDGLYATVGRPSVPPERLLRAQLLQIFYSIRSERLLMEQLDYNLLFRWFVGLELDEPIWVPTVFTKNRDRLLNQEIARSFFRRVVDRATGLMSDEHFTVDGTLIEAWASQKSFQRKDGPPPEGEGRNFHGEQRRNDTHASTTDPDAKLYKRTQYGEARLAYLGHLLVENRHGLIVDAVATPADGYAERAAARQMLAALQRRRGRRRRTVGADKAYDTRDFVVRSTRVRPGTPAMRRASTPGHASSPPLDGSRRSRGSGRSSSAASRRSTGSLSSRVRRSTCAASPRCWRDRHELGRDPARPTSPPVSHAPARRREDALV
jgi:transposase